jgi:hypothetical protein
MDPLDTLDDSKQNLPNATAVLVLGICSIVGCILYGLPGLVCGIIALVLSKKDRALYFSNPVKYGESFKISNAGRVCAIVGTCLSGAYLVIVLLMFTAIFSRF